MVESQLLWDGNASLFFFLFSKGEEEMDSVLMGVVFAGFCSTPNMVSLHRPFGENKPELG